MKQYTDTISPTPKIIKSYFQDSHLAIQKNNSIIKGIRKNEYSWKLETRFVKNNLLGKITEEKVFEEDSSLFSINTYSYEEKKLALYESFNEDRNLNSYIRFKYNSKKNRIKTQLYSSNNELLQEEINTYNSRNLMITKKSYNSSAKLIENV